MERSIEELERERERWLRHMKEYTISGVYSGPEFFVNLYRSADRELEEMRRQQATRS